MMLPSCLLDVVYDYALQLKVHAVNCEIKRKMRLFEAEVRPHLVEMWLDWVEMEHPRALYFAHIYGPENDYQFDHYLRPWWFWRG